MNRKTLGAIDIGSNAIRMLIDYVESYDDGRVEYKKAAFVRVPIRLGEDVFKDGQISITKADALCDAMQGFSALLRAFGTTGHKAYATSAMREACNGTDITNLIHSRSGIKVEIIDGEKEADTIYAAGGLRDLLKPSKNYLYVDVGGGSTEIVVYAHGEKAEARSFKIGTVRIISHAVDEQERKRFSNYLGSVAEQYNPYGIIGSGGNINKAHKMLEKKSKESITAKELITLYESLRDMSIDRRMEEMLLNQSRAEVIVPALEIFTEVVRRCGIDSICVPRQGLADGMIHQIHTQSRGQ